MARYNKKTNNNKDKDIQYITLPYDFIEFPERWVPYNIDTDSNKPPRHDQVKQLNGYIKYKLIPQSGLAIEIKKGEADQLFVSGSLFRGVVRKNAEILSQNYPRFIDGNPILYRDMTGELKREYREKLNIEKGIEKAVEVGFLKKNGANFYIVPADKWQSGKNFVSIKEHRIKNMGLTINSGKSMLYETSDINFNKYKEINKIEETIDILTKEIKHSREELKEELSCIQQKVNIIFIKDFGFIKNRYIFKGSDFDEKLKGIAEDLLNKLNKLSNSNKELEEFFSKMVDRWKLKAKIHNIYSRMKPNEGFNPISKRSLL